MDAKLVEFLKNNIITLGLIYVFLSAIVQSFGWSHSGDILSAIANAVKNITGGP